MAYVEPGLPILQTSRGIGLPGGIMGMRLWGVDGVVLVSFSVSVECDLRVVGWLGGVRADDLASDDVPGEFGDDF